MSVPSTVPIAPGQPNPYYHKAEWLVREQERFLKMQRAIRQKAYDHPELTFEQIRDWAEGMFYEEFAAAVEEFEVIEAPQQTMGPPPTPRDLYGRFADKVKIRDVGSGNCAKLNQAVGRLRVVAIDPAIPEDKAIAKMTMEPIRLSIDLVELPVNCLISSFNSLIQLKPEQVDRLRGYDGLHIIPDHEQLLDLGVAKEEGGKVIAWGGGVKYSDYRLDMPGWSVKEGYKLVATYRPLEADLVMAQPREWLPSTGYEPRSEAMPATEISFDWRDVGYKWDGTFLECWVNGGAVRFYDRAGRYRDARTDVDLGRGLLHLEHLKTKTAEAYVLLRVMIWHNMLPPHSGDSLRQFAKRVRLRVDGVPVYGPPRFSPMREPRLGGQLFPVDGLISRNGERDYYAKRIWTVDMRPPDIKRLTEILSHRGLGVQADVQDGLWEYQVEKKDSIVSLTPMRGRTDKKEATRLETCEYLVSLPNLFELAVMNGCPAELEGLRPFLV